MKVVGGQGFLSGPASTASVGLLGKSISWEDEMEAGEKAFYYFLGRPEKLVRPEDLSNSTGTDVSVKRLIEK